MKYDINNIYFKLLYFLQLEEKEAKDITERLQMEAEAKALSDAAKEQNVSTWRHLPKRKTNDKNLLKRKLKRTIISNDS